jgi:hypothetical protein
MRSIHPPDQLNGPIPNGFWQALRIRDRLEEIHRCDMKAPALLDWKKVVKFRAAETTWHNCGNELRKVRYVGIPAAE